MDKLTKFLEFALGKIDPNREADNAIESITEADDFARRLILATI